MKRVEFGWSVRKQNMKVKYSKESRWINGKRIKKEWILIGTPIISTSFFFPFFFIKNMEHFTNLRVILAQGPC